MKIGFTIGKFAPLHKGHQYLIEKGLKEMDKFYVIIYETNVTNISIENRANWIKEKYSEVNIIYAKNPPSQYGLDEESVKIQTDYLKELVKDIKVTHFYNSEPYGKFVARDLNVQEVQVDREREKYPISATKIRNNIEENQKYIEKNVYGDIINKMNKNGKIGIFDSGIGGVTVLREILKILPEEDYIYYSDSKNNPYGDKTEEEIKQICDKIVKYLIEKKCKVIVIACNTASAIAAQYLREKYPEIPFIAIEPAYKMVHDYAYDKPTLVMATKGTIESEKFNLLFEKYDNYKTYLLPCVGLAELIEQGDKQEVIKYLRKNIGIYKDKVQNVVLGCTHYPLIENEIKEVLGQVQFFNGASNLAKHLKNIIEEKNLLNRGKGKIEFEDSQNLEIKKNRFFGILKEEI